MSKPCENCGCDLKVCKDCDLHTGKYFKTELQAELEKLRSELHETAEMHIDGDYYLRDEWIDEYIDNHISERRE